MQDKYFLIGTAGHVDHGKSQLIHALTGLETDRLKEEKERGISIELGFAYLTLPDGKKAGIVDVPGHEKFVRQMLAGASGMDIVLMVVAADEGVMPQTQEHLDILKLLNIKKGIVVLTKIDLVDQEWLSFVEQDTREKFKNSFLENAPYCHVSSITGEGIDQLLTIIIKLLNETETRPVNFPARMPVDRVFTIQGFGTVATGTLDRGIIKRGQELVIEPGNRVAKVRNIQVHGEKVLEAYAGQRAAINLSNIAINEIKKGSWLVSSGYYRTGDIVDVELKNLENENRAIVQRQRVRFHIGTAETLGRVHLLNKEELLPGESCYAQILLENSILAIPGDRFVIRFYSPLTTIGGGTVIGFAARKKKRFQKETIEDLKIRAKGSSQDLVMRYLSNPNTAEEISNRTGLPEAVIKKELEFLESQKLIYIINTEGSTLYWLKEVAEKWGKQAAAEIRLFNERYPLRNGIGREELKNKLGVNIPLKLWQALLEWGERSNYFRLSGSNVQSIKEMQLPPKIQKQINCLVEMWEKSGLNPPSLNEAAQFCNIPSPQIQEYAAYLVSKGLWLKIGDLYFTVKAIHKAKQDLKFLLQKKGRITASEARNHWQVSRKYAIPLLEYFDSICFTKRDGETRILYENN